MASNVFGVPVTTEVLEGLPEYQGKITRTDRAHVALEWKNSDDKDVNARTYVENLKAQWGTGVSTLCVIYNATGDPLTFILSHDYHGHIGPAPYPARIENGQWGGFLHVKTSGAATGSSAAVVYRGLNEADNGCDWMLSWSNPWNTLWNNTAYTEIRQARHYQDEDNWNYISGLIEKSVLTHDDNWNGCLSNVSTGSSTSPIFEGIMTLVGA